MRVLHTESGLNWGGQEFRTLIECQWLNDHGHQSWIMCHPESELYKRGRQQGLDFVIPMTMNKVWRLDVWIRVLLFTLLNKVDIVNSHGSRDSTICLAAFLAGKPLLRSRQVTVRIKKKFSYQFGCSHIVAAAQVIKDALIAVGVAPEKITVVGEGVDVEEYSPRPKPARLIREFSIAKDEKVVVNIGMIRPDKGQNYLLEAAAKILAGGSKVRFFIIGDATRKTQWKAELEKLIAELGVEQQCLMVGYRDDVADFINLADLVVIASTGTEAQSRIVPQSFASKTTVVSTDAGGLTELVSDQFNGLVVPLKDVQAMAVAIETLLSDDQLRSSFEERAHEFALEKLSLDLMMEKTVSLYQKFC